jgi:indolepyruvate decarboxylase
MASSYGEMIQVTDVEARIGYQRYRGVALPDFVDGLLARFTEDSGLRRDDHLPDVPPDPVTAYEPGDALSYEVFFHELAQFLGDEGLKGDVVLVLGESTSLYVFGNLFGLPPNSFVGQAAWGSLGHETGCALGVALASGKRPFVVAGDGGFRMVCQELSSLVTQRCNAVVFVIANDAYAIEQAFVDIQAFAPSGQFAPFDVLPPWDYRSLAGAFGAMGYKAATVESLRAVLSELQSLADVPTLVEIVIPQKDLAPQLARLAAAPPSRTKYRPRDLHRSGISRLPRR